MQPHYDAAKVLGLIPNQLVQELGHFKFVPKMEWLVRCIVLENGFPQNSPNDFSHHIMMLPKFWARSEISCSKNWDISSSYEVRAVHLVVVGLQSCSNWISLKSHRMTPSTILRCFPNFGLDPKSIGK